MKKQKTQITIPRLELCGAMLLSQLLKQVIDALQIRYDSIYMWTDSKITLAWIRGNPKRWKTFIANKTIKINSLTSKDDWHYVTSANNPADVASRGIYPKDMKKHSLWWNGPEWLQMSSAGYPNDNNYDTNEEQKENKVVLTTTMKSDLLPDVSSYIKLEKAMAWCSRFINNCNKNKKKTVRSDFNHRITRRVEKHNKNDTRRCI